jgi:hypothetical protein
MPFKEMAAKRGAKPSQHLRDVDNPQMLETLL